MIASTSTTHSYHLIAMLTLRSLLYPVLCLLHQIPFTDLSPPLSQTIHVLLSIPFLPRLFPVWHLTPEPTAISSPPSTSTVRTLFTKFTSSTSHPRSTSGESVSPSASTSGVMSPTLPSPQSRGRVIALPPRRTDTTALPQRLLSVLKQFFDIYLPQPTKPDDELQKGLMLDETLPPILLLLARAAAGSDPIRGYLKETLLPADLSVYAF